MLDKFMKAAKVKSEEEFLAKYPSEEAFFKAFPKFKNGGNIPKAKGGMKVTSERWDPNLQMWVLDEGMPAKKMQPQKAQPFSMMENPYAGVFNQNQLDNTFFKPYNQVNYDGIITPNYMRTEFNPQTNKWDKVNQVDKIELQPQYTGDWSNPQRQAFEAQQPAEIGAYKTTRGKRRSRYNTEYDDMYKKGGSIPTYDLGGLVLPTDNIDPTTIDPQLIGNQSHVVSQMDLQAIENPNQVNQIQPKYQNNLDTKGYQPKQTNMKKVGTGLDMASNIMDNISSGLQNFTKGTIMAGNALAMNVLGNTQRDDRLDREYQKPNYNQFAYGTGSQAIAKHGMSIPNEGTMDNLSIIEGGDAEVISNNPYTPETIQYSGQSHDNGGITIDYNGTPVEVEGGETQTGNVVFGNMKIPGTNTKFKDASKQLAKEELKASKILSTGEQLLNIEPINAYRTLKANSGKLLTEIADKKLQEAAQTKEHLSFIQDMMLKGKEQSKKKNGGEIEIAKDGLTLAERNNNPGNLRFIGQKGAVKGDSGFAKFESYDDGFNAMINDLKAKQTGRTKTGLGPNSTLSDLINVYAPAADKNNPVAYSNTVAKLMGVTPDTKIGDLDTNELAKSMAAVEDGAYSKKMKPQSTFGQKPRSIQERSQVITPLAPLDFSPLPQTSLGTDPLLEQERPLGNNNVNYYDSPEYRAQLIENSKQQNQIIPLQTNSVSPEQPIKKLPSLADKNKLGFSDIAPEIGTLLSNIQGADFVQGQQYDPTLYTPYQVSFQDRLNENNAQLKAMERLAVNNPSAMATLAAQNYQANNSVLGEQFRANQAITNDVINKNVSVINDAEMKNIGLRDQQYARQAQADANTKQQIFDAMSSISNKFSKNKKENVDIRLKENMFPNFRPSEDGKYEMTVQGERYMFDPLTNTMTPIVTSKKKEVVKDGDKTTTTESVQANKRLTKKWGGWI